MSAAFVPATCNDEDVQNEAAGSGAECMLLARANEEEKPLDSPASFRNDTLTHLGTRFVRSVDVA